MGSCKILQGLNLLIMKERIVLSIVLVFFLSSCDQIRGVMGMATSADIEKARKELAVKKAKEQSIVDSLAVLQQDTLLQNSTDATASMGAENPAAGNAVPNGTTEGDMGYTGALDQRYYIIIGSFKQDHNTRSMLAFLKKQGYHPVKIPLKNGYDMVSLCGYDSYAGARDEIAKIEQWEICPYDVWIYDINQKLHK